MSIWLLFGPNAAKIYLKTTVSLKTNPLFLIKTWLLVILLYVIESSPKDFSTHEH